MILLFFQSMLTSSQNLFEVFFISSLADIVPGLSVCKLAVADAVAQFSAVAAAAAAAATAEDSD